MGRDYSRPGTPAHLGRCSSCTCIVWASAPAPSCLLSVPSSGSSPLEHGELRCAWSALVWCRAANRVEHAHRPIRDRSRRTVRKLRLTSPSRSTRCPSTGAYGQGQTSRGGLPSRHRPRSLSRQAERDARRASGAWAVRLRPRPKSVTGVLGRRNGQTRHRPTTESGAPWRLRRLRRRPVLPVLHPQMGPRQLRRRHTTVHHRHLATTRGRSLLNSKRPVCNQHSRRRNREKDSFQLPLYLAEPAISPQIQATVDVKPERHRPLVTPTCVYHISKQAKIAPHIFTKHREARRIPRVFEYSHSVTNAKRGILVNPEEQEQRLSLWGPIGRHHDPPTRDSSSQWHLDLVREGGLSG